MKVVDDAADGNIDVLGCQGSAVVGDATEHLDSFVDELRRNRSGMRAESPFTDSNAGSLALQMDSTGLTTADFDSSCLHCSQTCNLLLVSSVIIQFRCSYSALPLYAVMRSSFDEAIFAENVQAGLLGCAEGARKNTTNSKATRECIKHHGATKYKVCRFQNVVLQDASAAGGRNADITVP
ncbi:F-box ankyrin repeat protein [Musa troglodytarum]|uniref:F-box ankyrin repeat protein n=1 Tax=Musa troglodytarum TaxID=320322 RepID=A0A9E7LG58_9LILI|nr:F-box ankyrin repeat protein [Musa troglodytarum]